MCSKWNRDLKTLMAGYGYQVHRTNGNRHPVWKHPETGRIMSTSQSPSDGNAIKSITRQLRRNAAMGKL